MHNTTTNSNSTIGEKERHQFKILAVEDDDVLCRLIDRVLDLKGFTNRKVVKDGLSALKEFAYGEYDIVILDLGLPDLSGFYVAVSMKAIDKYRNQFTPVLALTAFAEHARDDALRAGVDTYMDKPYDFDSFEERIVIWLEAMMLYREQLKGENKPC